MILSMAGQAWLFLSTLMVGAAIGLFYDVFRIFRKTARHSTLAVQLEDLLFWVAATGLTFYYMLHRNYGEIRVFAVVGVGIGLTLYLATISRLVVKIFVEIINYIKKVVAVAVKIILIPLKLVLSWLRPPIAKVYAAAHKQGMRAKRFCKQKARKTAREWGIMRKKV